MGAVAVRDSWTIRNEARLLVAPSLLFLICFSLVPFVVLILFSVLDLNLSKPANLWAFVGLKHYRTLLQADASFDQGVIRTLQFTAIGVFFELGIGLALGLFLYAQSSWVQSFIVSVAILPMMMAPVAVGLMWLFLLQPDYGLISHLLKTATGFNGALLARPDLALLVVRLIDVWEWTPFVTLVVLAGLTAIPRDIRAAADVDGLRWKQRIQVLYWPALRGVLVVALLLRVIEAVKVFDIVYILTGGGPGNTTEMVSVYIQRLAIRETQFGYGAAATLLFEYLLLLLTAAFFRVAVANRKGSS